MHKQTKPKQYSITLQTHQKSIQLVTPLQPPSSPTEICFPSQYTHNALISSISQNLAPQLTHSINTNSINNVEKPDNMYKVISMMRQQIQIANKFYTDKIKILLQEQAKEICKLNQRINQNQRQIIKKNIQIQNLINQKQTTPKKKLSVVSPQPQQQNLSSQTISQLSQKITNLQIKLQSLSQNIMQKNQLQKQLNNKIECCEKGTIKYLAVKLGNCVGKLQQFMIKKQCDIQRIYSHFNNLSKSINPALLATSQHNPNNINLNIKQQQNPASVKINNINKQIQQLKQQINQLKTKQYHYDNYQVQRLKKQINKIIQNVDKLGIDLNKIKNIYLYKEKQKQGKQIVKNININKYQQKNTNTNNNINSKRHSNNQTNYQSQKLISYNSQHYSYNNNLMKSQKMMATNYTTNKPPSTHPKVTITYNNNNNNTNTNNKEISNNTNKINLSNLNKNKNINNNNNQHKQYTNNQQIGYQKSSNNINKYQNQRNSNPSININNQKQIQQNYQQQKSLLMNLSTPVLYKNSSQIVNTNFRTSPIYHNQNSTQLNKTMNLSTQASPHPHPRNTHSNPNIPLYTQFYEYEQQTSQNQQSLQYQPQRSDCQQYQQEQDSQYQLQQEQNQQGLQQRLINTIRLQRLSMPLLVQIDQTGCLKCVQNGMYLVDQNNDVFYLGEEQMRLFGEKGILREVHGQ